MIDAWHWNSARRCIAIGLAVLGTARCDDGPIVAPTDATMVLAITPSTIAAEGDTSRVSVYVAESDGAYVDDGTRVVLSVSGAVLCALPANPSPASAAKPCATATGDAWAPIVELRTHAGVASALLRSGATSGKLTVTAQSGQSSKSVDLVVSALVPATGSKGVLQAARDTLTSGQATDVTAFLTTPDGAPVADGTRVVFASSDTVLSLSRTVALTSAGFARTSARASEKTNGSKVVSVTMSSGAVSASASIQVMEVAK